MRSSETLPRRGARLALAATLSLALLPGCAGLDQGSSRAKEPDLAHGVGFSANCTDKPLVVLHEKFDIDDDDNGRRPAPARR
jgi:hypothetical protein